MHGVDSFLIALPAIFFIVDPIAVVPLFLAMTANDPAEKARATARRACWVAASLLIFFAFFGAWLFQVLGVSLGAFRVAGGLLLLLTAIDMLRARPSATRTSHPEQREGTEKDDIALVPLALPLLAGPGAVATVIVLMAEGPFFERAGAVVAAIVVTFLITWALLNAAPLVQRKLKKTGLALLERIFGLLLAAIAVQFMADGVKALLKP